MLLSHEVTCACGAKLYALSGEEHLLCLECGDNVAVPRQLRTENQRAVREKMGKCRKCGEESALPTDPSNGADCLHCGEPMVAPRRPLPRVTTGGGGGDFGGGFGRAAGIILALLVAVGMGVCRASMRSSSSSPSYPSPSYTRPTYKPPPYTPPPAYRPPPPPTHRPPPYRPPK